MKNVNLYYVSSVLEKIVTDATKLLGQKNEDYSFDDDVHYNFKTLAKACDVFNVDVTKPIGTIQFLTLLKIQRIFKLWNSDKPPVNESVDDTITDTLNYLVLGRTLQGDMDEKPEKD